MQAPLQARNDSDAAQTNIATSVAQNREIVDNRLKAVAQGDVAKMVHNSPRGLHERALNNTIDNSPRVAAQCRRINALFGGAVKSQGGGAMLAEASRALHEGKKNNSGLPSQLKSGIESLSGMSMDHVKVHYNSNKPAQLQAHAYAQGSEIFLSAGQERHLPHEAWHVVQQAQGRVRPTFQMKAGAVNDDPSLEKEADMMGERAAQLKSRHVARDTMAEEPIASVRTQRAADFFDPANLPMQCGRAVQRSSETSAVPAGAGIVQRIVHLTASQYQARISPHANLTQAAFIEYLKVVLNDELKLAQSYADDNTMLPCPDGVQRGQEAAIKHYFKAVKDSLKDANRTPDVAAADGLVQVVNAIIASAITINHPTYGVPPVGAPRRGVATEIPIPNSATRYSHAPGAGYEHSNLAPEPASVKWSNEADGQSKFAENAGAALLDAPVHAPRNIAKAVEDQTDIKVLTWDQAKRFLPRPLINLLFDVKSQLVTGAPIIDERTLFEQSERKATADQPGTLRGWHEDSKGALPSNGVAGIRVNEQAAIPGPSTALHDHYEETSRAGAGSAAGNALSPLGFAEYTGAGVEHIHNIKVVIDYVTNRVYLTLSHYQYWGLVKVGETYHFIPGESQELSDAKSKIASHATTEAAGGAYTLMHPWMEVLVP